jgi:hypothetical protein
MWNRENAIRLVGVVTKEYGKEIIAEGSKSVMGLEDHIDKMIAKILEVDSDIVTVAREWRKVIERAAMTEGIDKVKIILGQEDKQIVVIDDKLRLQENKADIEMIQQTEINSIVCNMLSSEMESEDNQTSADKRIEGELNQMEEVQEIKERENSMTSQKYQHTTTEESEDVLLPADSDSSLEKSIWAPNKDRCEGEGTLRAKVAAIKVLGNNAKHRERSLRWSIGRNVHLKGISEKFEHGNQWCIVTFDCIKGYEEAKRMLESKKEEYEQANLILEDNTEEDKAVKVVKNQDNRLTVQEEKRIRNKQAEKELKEITLRRKKRDETNIYEQEHLEKKEIKTHQTNRNSNLSESVDKITVWDLPVWAKRTQVFEMVRFLGRVKYIEMIKSASNKMRAEVELIAGTFDKEKLNEIWCLPFMNELLVRISIGTNNLSLLRTRNRFSKRLLDLPENTNEVLLWRQIKRSGAKALHIFKNSNNNNMRSATVYFEKQEDMLNSSKFLMSYYDNKLIWANNERQEAEPRSRKLLVQLEPEIYQKRSSKSVETRRRTELDREDTLKTITNEEDLSDSEEQRKKTQLKSAYPEKKRKEIREGKKKEDNFEVPSSSSVYRKQKQDPANTFDYMFQLIRGLEEKIQHMEWEAPNRS